MRLTLRDEDRVADENVVRIRGAVTEEPMFTRTAVGSERAKLTVVTLRTWRSGGRRHEQFQYHDIVAWNKVVRPVRDLRVGNRIMVIGYLNTHTWNDAATGLPMTRTEIVADNVIPLHEEAA